MFSLGHSTVVVLGSVAIAGTALALQHRIDGVRQSAELLARWCRPSFFGIAIVNLVVFHSVYRPFRRVRRGEPYVEEDFDLLLRGRGFLPASFARSFG